MKLTNKHNIPDIIVRAAKRDNYSRGKSIKSVTQLINPPRIDILRRNNFQRMTEDISDKLWMLMGKSIHSLLEQAAHPDYIVEERLFADILSWNVSGAIDVQRLDTGGWGLIDYKFTSAYAVMSEPDGKTDWYTQQNFYAWLMHENKNIRVEKIQICVIIRDWSRSSYMKDKKYPAAPIVMIDLPLWTLEKQKEYVYERVRLHQEAELSYGLSGELPECSDRERWCQVSKWAVYKTEESKRATRVFNTEAKARRFAGDAMIVLHRPGTPSRCEGNYCGVALWCDQFKEKKNETV